MFLEINLRNRCVTKTLLLARIKAIIFKELLDEIGFLGKRGVFTLGDARFCFLGLGRGSF